MSLQTLSDQCEVASAQQAAVYQQQHQEQEKKKKKVAEEVQSKHQQQQQVIRAPSTVADNRASGYHIKMEYFQLLDRGPAFEIMEHLGEEVTYETFKTKIAIRGAMYDIQRES